MNKNNFRNIKFKECNKYRKNYSYVGTRRSNVQNENS